MKEKELKIFLENPNNCIWDGDRLLVKHYNFIGNCVCKIRYTKDNPETTES